jgi:hypothetical protein
MNAHKMMDPYDDRELGYAKIQDEVQNEVQDEDHPIKQTRCHAITYIFMMLAAFSLAVGCFMGDYKATALICAIYGTIIAIRSILLLMNQQ